MLAGEFFAFNKGTGQFIRLGDWKAMDLDKAALTLLDIWPHGPLTLDDARKELRELKNHGASAEDLEIMRLGTANKKKRVDWNPIYERFRDIVGIRFFSGARKERRVYKVNAQNEVMSIAYAGPKDLHDALVGDKESWIQVKDLYNSSDLTAKVREKLEFKAFVEKMINDHLLNDETLFLDEEPKFLAWDDDNCYAYKRIKGSLLKEGPTPTWDEFLTRLDYPELFMAWVYSIIETNNTVRQVMWIKGKGEDGKSAVDKALQSFLTAKNCYSLKESDITNKFAASSAYGKAFLAYPDCDQYDLLRTPFIKSITGGDSVSIENKGETAFSSVIRAKLYVHSNKAPSINPERRFETSRLLFLNVAPSKTRDAMFEKRLSDEVHHFLANCKPMFDKHINEGRTNIKIPEKIFKEMMIACSSTSYHQLKIFEELNVEYGDDYVVEKSAVQNRLIKFREENALSRDAFEELTVDFEEVQKERGIVSCNVSTKFGEQRLGLKGLRLKESSNE